MKCFVHRTQDSVGICKNCQRGLCTECAADCGNGLACKGKCEERVYKINRFLDTTVHRKINSILFINISCGALFIAMGAYFHSGLNDWFIGTCFTLLGLVFLSNGIRHYNSNKKQKSLPMVKPEEN